MIDKFESKLHNWRNRFLSMGGKYVLIKAVLESLLVFWMSLAHIPASVLKILRQLIFTFLWTGSKKHQGYHLSRWEVLSRPKTLGGWGLKNLPLFHKVLSASTFWRILTKTGMWSTVIKSKYLHQLPVHIWLRVASEHPSSGSQT